ncbi:PilZ domain-containing protein [Anaerobacterium chartisolvens]|uniref:PilZ domain-containing protein n=1 Tax=Anaerobacterium chartisolvens TaxID=1297424 RepID=A0A369BBU9_9FIRM|nr:PilZ domain-containing protein [Anaerobacterium chartisolvens]
MWGVLEVKEYNKSLSITALVFHYTVNLPCNAVVLSLSEKNIVMRLEDESQQRDFSEGDPVVIAYNSGGEVIVKGFDVKKLNSDGTIELDGDELESDANKRLYERIPASYPAEIKAVLGSKRSSAVIKNASKYGMMLYSKADFKVGERLEVIAFMGGELSFMETTAVRKDSMTGYLAYGLRLNVNDTQSVRCSEQLLDFFRGKYLKGVNISSTQDVNGISISDEYSAFGSTTRHMLDDAVQKLDSLLKGRGRR